MFLILGVDQVKTMKKEYNYFSSCSYLHWPSYLCPTASITNSMFLIIILTTIFLFI